MPPTPEPTDYDYPPDDDPYYVGCECEVDWNCPLHADRVGTFLETRYADDGGW